MQLRHLAIGAKHRVGDGSSSGGGGQRRRAPTQPDSLCGIWSTECCAERLAQQPVLLVLLLPLLLLQLLLQGRQLAFQLLPLGVRLRQLALQCADKRDQQGKGVARWVSMDAARPSQQKLCLQSNNLTTAHLELVNAGLRSLNGALHALQQRLCQARRAAAGRASGRASGGGGGQAGKRRGWGGGGRRLAAGGLQRSSGAGG